LYDVGARDEDPERTGFAHLFEHLMFGGSVNIPSYDEPLERAGGDNNAFTTNDLTNYYLTVPANNAETGFWLESDRMLGLAFSEKSLEVQRNVVMEEFKQRYLNQPYGDVWLHLKPLCYLKHPYQWNTIGKSLEHIETATMEEVKAFFHRHYLPSNAILVVAGALDEQSALDLAQKWFGTIEGGNKPDRNLPVEPPQEGIRRLTLERSVPQDALYMAFRMSDRLSADYYTSDVISDLLSNGHSARLYERLVKENPMFSEIGAYVSGDRDPGLFVVSGKLSEGIGLEEAEEAVWNELERMRTEPPSDRELQKVKNKMESLHQFSETNIMNKAFALAQFEWLGDAAMVNQELERYQAVTANEVQQLAHRMFVPNQCSILHYKAI
jgi:predicted Zn-dependent peptidase